MIGTGRAADRDTAIGLGVDAFLDLQADELEDAGEVDVVFDVIGGEILVRSTALVRAGGTLVTIARVPTVQPKNGRAIFFVVEPDRSRLADLVQRLRDGAQLAARALDNPSRVQRTVQTGGELILAGLIAANVLVVGTAVGAYGARMLRAMLPQGPVELAAYTLALAVYLRGRRQRLPARQLAGPTATSVVLLAAAAVLETFVNV